MRRLLITLLAAGLGLSGGLLAGCGDRNGLLPRTDADRLKASVDEVAAAVSRKDCARATTALQQAQTRADNLPSDVDPKLRRAINAGLSQLVQDVQAECSRTTSTQRTQTETVPTETTTTPTETTTTPTDTAPPQTETTPTDQTPTTSDQTGGTPPGQAKKQRRSAQN